jgi:GNAT superfamily N-acetyltransferase
MRFLTITAANDPNLPFVKDLYMNSFPQEERREWPQLTNKITTSEEMTLQVMEEDGRLLGFWIFWVLDDWCFLEHFAIDPVWRSKQYGRRMMQELMRHNQVLLEVEPPHTHDAIRRIEFYENLGLRQLPINYLQPSYINPDTSYPMILMTNATATEGHEYSSIIRLVQSRVYNSDPK